MKDIGETTVLFKSYYLNKNLFYLFGIGSLISILIFLGLKLNVGLKFQISCTIIGIGSLAVLYLNKFEPHFIKLYNNEFTIDYINKFIFKTNRNKYLKEDIKALVSNDILILYNDSKKIAVIRKKAVEADEWIVLNKYFLLL